MARPEESVVLFDGVCNLCSGWVQFIIKRDPKAIFRFASLQSGYARARMVEFNLDPNSLHSVILIHNNVALQQSDAALEIVRRLTGVWPLLYGLRIVPRFIRNALYKLIARNRYAWFGKKAACWIPTPELKSRFLD